MWAVLHQSVQQTVLLPHVMIQTAAETLLSVFVLGLKADEEEVTSDVCVACALPFVIY